MKGKGIVNLVEIKLKITKLRELTEMREMEESRLKRNVRNENRGMTEFDRINKN